MNLLYWLGKTTMGAAVKALFGLEVVHPEKRIESGPAIIAANHASFLDPPVVGISYESGLHFLARSTLFRGFLGWLLPRWNAVPIDREQADLKSMRTILRTLREGKRVVMFPEGTRSPDGSLGRGKAGIGMLIAKSGVPVQPVRVLGSYEALPRSNQLRFHPLRVVIGDPVEFPPEELQGRSRESYQAIADRVMAEIGKLG